MEKELKKLLKELKGKETSRKDALAVMDAEMKRIDLREETESERFAGERDKDGNWLKRGGIYDDIKAGVYNHRTEGEMQKVIDEELRKIKEKYDVERAQLSQKIEETQRSQEEEKKADYKKISTAIKDYHLDMVLEVNKQNKKLTEIEAERNGKLEEIDKLIAEKEAQKTHLIMKNRDFMDIEASEDAAEIRALGEDIERLKAQKEGINEEYVPKLKEQSDTVQYYSQQKERASKFMGSIILSEKSIEEIYDILFQKGKKKENQSEQNQEQESQEQQSQRKQNQNGQDQGEENQEQQNQEQESQNGPTKTEPTTVEQGEVESTQSQEKQNTGSKTSGFDWSKFTVPGEQSQEKNNTPKPSEKNSKKLFSYEFSAQGISYDRSSIDTSKLLKWYNDDKENVKKVMRDILGGKDEAEDFQKEDKVKDFLEGSDKFIYLSILYRGSKEVNGELIVDEQTKSRLIEYYNVWTNPEKQEKSNMQITYDLKNTSAIARLFKKTKFTKEQIENVKENAFLLRKRKDVTIKHGLVSKIQFYIKDRIESAREMKLLNEAKQQNGKKENKPSWLLTEEQLEQANEPVQPLEGTEKSEQPENSEVR